MEINRSELPRVIVLILSYNGKHLLNESISSYLANDYPDFEVVVIDNGSFDGSREWVEQNHPQVLVLRIEKNQGYSGGFNIGLEYAFIQCQADYVLITNNDVKADYQAISSLVQTAGKSDLIGFITGKVFYFDEPNIIQSVGYLENPMTGEVYHRGQKQQDTGEYDKDEPLVCSDDIFMLVSKKVYDEVGGYDPELLFQCEQWDWQERGKKRGFQVYFCANARIWHKESMTIGKNSAFKVFYDIRNTMVVIYVHKNSSQFRSYFWNSFRNNFVKGSIKHLLKGNFQHVWANISGFISGLCWVLHFGRNRKEYLK